MKALCVCCPECRCSFLAITMEKESMDMFLWEQICHYVDNGAIIEIREYDDIKFKYCKCHDR